MNITGTAGNDKLIGTPVSDVLTGLGGNDILIGGQGDDAYYAENFAGNRDTIVEQANGGFDAVAVQDPNTRSFTLAANVEALYNLGDIDHFIGIGNAGDNVLIGGANRDALNGEAGNDQMDGGDGIDLLWGGAGSDTLYDDFGGDTLVGGTGDDTYIITTTTTVVEAKNGGTDVIWADFDLDLGDYANVENLRLAGTGDLDAIGNALGNVIIGNDGGNDIVGGAGNDWIEGGDGSDDLGGNAGNDVLHGDAGDDFLDGGAGNDRLDGGTGADQMAGGAGNDIYFVDDAGDTVLEAIGGGTDRVYSSVSWTMTNGQAIESLTLKGTDNIDGTGNDFANVIVGNAGNNTLSGGFGSDTLIGGKGDDHYVLTVFDAGDKIVEQAGGGVDEVDSSISTTLGANIEHLWLAHGGGNLDGTGNNLGNTLIGNDGDNTLSGLAGNDVLDGMEGTDTLIGGAGNDTLDGGDGVDLMIGGAGNDTYYIDNPNDVIVEQAKGGTMDGVVVAYADVAVIDLSKGQFANLEYVTLLDPVGASVFCNAAANIVNGSAGSDFIAGEGGDDLLRGRNGNDSISGGDGNDVLNGGAGDDYLAGGAGNDTYIVDSFYDMVDESIGGSGWDTVQSSVSFDLRDGNGHVHGAVENLVLTGTDDLIGVGNDLANILIGNDGGDTLYGLGGKDRLEGGGGDDYLAGGDGNDTLHGGAGNDQLTGDAGNDVMMGGTGDDAYLVDSAKDKVVESAGQGHDTVYSTIAGYTLGANVEDLVFTGQIAHAVGNGNALGNSIVGGDGDDRLDGKTRNDQLFGNFGSDVLIGGAGDDVLEGGLGSDTLIGGAGKDAFVYRVNQTGDLAFLGNDTITGFEHGKDTIDVRDLFQDFGIATNNPFAAGYLQLQSVGTDTLVKFDANGGGDNYVTLAIVHNTTTAAHTPTEADILY